MRVLFFDEDVTGHHMEYLHHYYLGAMEHQENEYVFCIPKSFKEKYKLYTWKKAENISFSYLTNADLKYIASSNLLISAWKRSIILRKKYKENGCNRIMLTTLALFIPFVCMLLPSHVKVSGIIYSVFLYNKAKWSKTRFVLERIRFWIVVKSRCMDRVFVLNDKKSCLELNKLYKTTKFTFLPDPVPNCEKREHKNLRCTLGIPSANKIYLQFGGMAKRKGTIEILKALELMSHNELDNKTFVFAGKIYDDIHDEFYRLIEHLKNKTQIVVFDEFCTYELLYDLCYTSDIVLMPYHETNLSSGVLGYASLFGKMVIGPSDGLIGRLIIENNLGMTIDNVTPHSIRNAIASNRMYPTSKDYANANTQENFIKQIFNA